MHWTWSCRPGPTATEVIDLGAETQSAESADPSAIDFVFDDDQGDQQDADVADIFGDAGESRTAEMPTVESPAVESTSEMPTVETPLGDTAESPTIEQQLAGGGDTATTAESAQLKRGRCCHRDGTGRSAHG